ncbi:MAG: dipicolinate synthase subunit B [Clostridium sp.]|nr:dipicolinate synthase subunit B [Clostridium sp.]
MELNGKNIGLAITGSFCTFSKIEQEILKLKETGAILHPIFSANVQTTDSRFGDTGDFIRRISGAAGNAPILHIEEAEPIGPRAYLDLLLIAPCTGNTLAKLANGITDTPVLMAAKAHLRNGKPLVISLSTNDALGINFKNIGELFNAKNIYFVPFGQDDCLKKPCSMTARTELIQDTLKEALEGRQLQPVIRGI